MSKQVNGADAQCSAPQSQNRNLYVTVNTYNFEGKQIGTRVVDMYHYGTRNWLSNHLWWATHNAHEVVTIPSTEDEVTTYLADAKNQLASKYEAAA